MLSLTPSVTRRRLAPVLLLSLLACGTSWAEEPFARKDQPVRIIVGFPPGGGQDVLARAIAAPLGKELNLPVVVENRPGAGGQTALEYVARARGDGYTLHIASAGPYIITPLINRQRAPAVKGITTLSFMPLVLVAPTLPQSPADLKGLVVKARAGSLSYASGGAGTLSHVAAEYLNIATHTKSVHIPYKGSTPAAVDTASGVTDFSFLDPSSVIPLINAGKLRALAVSMATRAAELPGIPTFAEAGVEFEVINWYGLAAPGSTPPLVVDRLNKAVVKALEAPDLRKSMSTNGMALRTSSARDFDAFLESQSARWKRIIDEAQIVLDQ